MPVVFCVQSNFKPQTVAAGIQDREAFELVYFSQQLLPFLLEFLTNANSKFIYTLAVHTLIKLQTYTLNILLMHTRDLIGNCQTLQSG